MLSFSTSLPMPTGFLNWKILAVKVTPMVTRRGSLHIFGISSSKELTGWGCPRPTLQRMIGFPVFAEQSMRLTTSETKPPESIYAPTVNTAMTVPRPLFLSKPMRRIEHYSFCQRTRNVYNAFLTANQGMKRSRQEILRAPYFTNPFYNDYNVLIDLSKQVISQQGSDFDSQHDSSAFFFDISMLFEYFIRKLIKRDGVRLLSKFEQRYEIPGRCSRQLYAQT